MHGSPKSVIISRFYQKRQKDLQYCLKKSQKFGKQPIRILHVIHWPKSGIVSLVRNIILIMNKYGIQSHILFFYYDKDTVQDFKKICKSISFLSSDKLSIISYLNFYQVLKTISPDVIHSHSFQPMILASFFKLGRCKNITTVHSDYPHFTEKMVKAVIKRNVQKYVMAVCKVWVAAVSKTVYLRLCSLGINTQRLFLVENGIPIAEHKLSKDTFEKIRKNIGINQEDSLIISVGRLHTQKGFEILIKSFSMICGKFSTAKLIFIGDGPERLRLKKLVQEYNLQKKVQFLGYKQNPFPYLAASDIYVCSSLYEGFPLSVAEAMLCKLPVVATNVSGIPSMIAHGESGILVEPGNPEALAAALEDLILNRFDKEKLGKNARACIKNKYDIRITARSYFKLYKNIVDMRC